MTFPYAFGFHGFVLVTVQYTQEHFRCNELHELLPYFVFTSSSDPNLTSYQFADYIDDELFTALERQDPQIAEQLTLCQLVTFLGGSILGLYIDKQRFEDPDDAQESDDCGYAYLRVKNSVGDELLIITPLVDGVESCVYLQAPIYIHPELLTPDGPPEHLFYDHDEASIAEESDQEPVDLQLQLETLQRELGAARRSNLHDLAGRLIKRIAQIKGQLSG